MPSISVRDAATDVTRGKLLRSICRVITEAVVILRWIFGVPENPA